MAVDPVVIEGIQRRLDNHGDRIGALERQVAVSDANIHAMQQDICEAKDAAKDAAKGVDGLKMWLLLTCAAFATNLLYMLLKGAN